MEAVKALLRKLLDPAEIRKAALEIVLEALAEGAPEEAPKPKAAAKAKATPKARAKATRKAKATLEAEVTPEVDSLEAQATKASKRRRAKGVSTLEEFIRMMEAKRGSLGVSPSGKDVAELWARRAQALCASYPEEKVVPKLVELLREDPQVPVRLGAQGMAARLGL